MANRITYDRCPNVPDLLMSNGASGVFWDVLRLAGEALEQLPGEDEPLGWLVARAPTDHWFGFSGFDLDEMPWRADRFEQDRSALLQAIDLAVAGEGWDRLGYTPVPEFARTNLATFRALVSAYELPVLGRAEVYGWHMRASTWRSSRRQGPRGCMC